MIQDLHSHTLYSFCGKDAPDRIVEAAISGGLDTFGICDHNYGIGYHAARDAFFQGQAIPVSVYQQELHAYFSLQKDIRNRYRDRIAILCGIEICTLTDTEHALYALPENADVSFFDYALVENLDSPHSLTQGDIFGYAKRLALPSVGIAHTDLFAHIETLGKEPLAYLTRMAEENIFWEMNVSYDSIHGYREHAYMHDFFADPVKQETVRQSGVRLSVGFDGHRVEDYLPERVREYNRRLTELGIRKAFE